MIASKQLVSPHSIDNLIIAGASVTNSPWFTWADFLIESTELPCQNFSSRGAGNEYIVSSLIKNHHAINKNSLVVVMLTSVDKFDWYVEKNRYVELQKEKHPPKPISDNSGFWCTGSWFPLEKDIYKELFYSTDYFCVKSAQQIVLLNQLCASKQCHLLILFDSPIWQYTEQSILKIGQEKLDPAPLKLSDLPYFDMWKDLLDQQLVNNAHNSLIGFCWDQQLPWYNETLKGHPPASSHSEFFKQIILPDISNLVKVKNIDFLANKIKKFDQLWNLPNK